MKIVTDCAADLPSAELHDLGILQAPLFIQFPDGEVSSAQLAPDEFYDRLEAMRPAIPTTAQPSAGDLARLYQAAAEHDPEVLSLHISSGLSGTLGSARVAQSQAPAHARITLWDTLTLSGAQRFQVLAAAWAARSGWVLSAIQQRLAQIRAQSELLYTLDTLEYLARGGRIGRVQALAGALLNLKPVIGVDHGDGKYNTVGRSRTLARALTAIVDHLHGLHPHTPLWVTVLHGRLADQADALAHALRQRLTIARLETLRISPVLGVHTGPAIVGVAAVPLHLFADLLPPAG
jgi:DegV family protein with EDD domain